MHKGLVALFSVFSLAGYTQQKPEILEYITKYKDVAIEEMVRTNIPASITLAQGILESGCGKSELATKANNHFGIKCKDEWTGKRFHQDDDAPNECFRVYETARESYADHSEFLLTRSRYANLFKLPAGDYKAWAVGLKEAGYATNPKYASILIGNIETYNLHDYDNVGYAIIKANGTPIFQGNTKETPPATPIQTNQPNTAAKSTERETYLVNGVRAVKAKAGEDPFTFAFEYNIDYLHVLAFNDLSSGEKFKEGEFVFLQPKKSKGEERLYVVKNEESMRDIAQKLGIRLKDLYYKNLMSGNDQPMAGEELYLQDKRATAPKTISYTDYLKSLSSIYSPSKLAPITNSNAAYQVQQKDTLYSIAQKFNTTVEKIRELNDIGADSIKAGQTLVVTE